MNKLVQTTYSQDEVTVLLKDITGLVEPLNTKEREKLNQSGVHYSEMLPLEYKPSEKYMEIYEYTLKNNAHKTAQAIVNLGDSLYKMKSNKLVLVSLARAGTPIGILLKRYLKLAYDINVPHYSISIIRGKGIDTNALNYIVEKEKDKIDGIQFVDGWIGKGAINKALFESLYDYCKETGVLLNNHLAVLSDPANVVPDEYCGSRDDFIIPSSCLNATVSGLFSRTFRRPDIIGKDDFDGAIYYGELENEDRSIEFLDNVTDYLFGIYENRCREKQESEFKGIDIVTKIAKDFGVKDINKIKPRYWRND